jgi:acyl-[acyl-carrier-protein]-phospholipid O-acyltransferase/long-chain-fatty-acid--[acyl-carrier-protein] ligase
MKSEAGYGDLLKDRGFEAFLWTQLLGAFNDNVFRMIVSIFAVHAAAGSDSGSRYLALSGAIFVIPFLLFAGYAGYLADRFSKTSVLQITKAFEIVTMLLAIPALLAGRIEWLLVILFLLAAQANFFGPAKYGILPEMLEPQQITRANGLLELTTFVAIVVGTSFGTILYEHSKNHILRMSITLLVIAIIGSLASLAIRKVPVSAPATRFHWNPFHEIVQGAGALRRRKSLAFAVAGLSWFWFVGALFQMALLLEGSEVLHVSEALVGLLVTALAGGIGIGSIVAGTLSGDHIELGLIPAGSALMGVCSIASGFSTNYLLVILCLAGVGFGGGLFAVPLNAFLQEEAALGERGRVMATNNFVNMIGVIVASGFLWLLHDHLRMNPATILLALGTTMLLGSLCVAIRMREALLRFTIGCLATALFRIRVEGREHIPATGPALLISNHVSYVDSVLVSYAVRQRTVRFLMWQPIFELPGANHLFRTLRAIPIKAGSPKSTIDGLRAARQELLRGELVAIFPEGSISLTGEANVFNRGFEKVINGTDAPLVPIHTTGLYGHPLSYKGGGPFRSWEKLWRPLVTVRVGKPLDQSVTVNELRSAVLNA